MTRFQPSPRPETTPWDAPDRADQVLPGIWRVSTPSHGGYVLSDERQAAMPEALRRDDPYYEEDVDYALVLYAFGSEFRRLPIPIARLDPVTGVWNALEMPAALRQLTLAVDFVAGLALAMFPITASMRIAEFMDESRRLKAAAAQSSPSADDAP